MGVDAELYQYTAAAAAASKAALDKPSSAHSDIEPSKHAVHNDTQHEGQCIVWHVVSTLLLSYM